MTDLAGKQLGGCEILAQIGQGGMGTVYKARQVALDRVAAIKILPPQFGCDEDFIARFSREAAAAAQLSHPNIVQVYSAGMQDDLRYFVMEFVDGESVQHRLKRKGRIPADEALAICMYVIQGLAYAWQRSKLIHRDIKPDNIFLSKAGEVKLGDLGLAKIAGGQNSGLTLTGSYMGTPYFISPEQARGLKSIDFRADIYSLGCTLYHMVTGHLPYEPVEGDNALSIMFKHVNEPVPDIRKVWPECPTTMARLITRMIQKKPEERFASYEDLLTATRSVVADLINASTPYGPIRQVPLSGHKKTPIPPRPPFQQAKPAGLKGKLETQPSANTSPSSKSTLENQDPSFAQIMIGTVVTSALLLSLFLWHPWQSGAPEASETRQGTTQSNINTSISSQQPRVETQTVSNAAAANRPPISLGSTFINDVAALPPEQQVAKVIAKLKELNLDFAGNETHVITNGVVEELTLPTETIRNISPLAALRNLKRLRIASPYGRISALSDLGSLVGLPLSVLDCHASAVTSLAPLAGLPLEELDVSACLKLYSLAPLKGLKLRRLNIGGDKLLSDFLALQGMPLEELQCAQTQLHDLTPLQGLPLRILGCDAVVTSDARQVEILRSFKSLERINDQLATEYWKNMESRALLQAQAQRQPDADASAWQNAINLLPLIDPASDALRGDWAQTATALISDRSRGSVIEIPYRPPEEYDFRIEFALLRKGSAGIQCVSKAGHGFTWNCFHAGGTLFGFECIDEKPLPENPSAINVEPPEIGRRYVSLVEVRSSEIRGYLDGRLIRTWKTNYANLKASTLWKLRDASLLGLGCQMRTAFYSVRVREVTGKGAFTRPSPSTGAPVAPVRRD